MSDVEWCERLLSRLSAAIAKEAPAGVGAWDEAWSRVELSSRALLDELRGIEGGGGDRERAKGLGLDVLAAWRHVGARFRAGGGVAA